jgi:hypothetical protein
MPDEDDAETARRFGGRRKEGGSLGCAHVES